MNYCPACRSQYSDVTLRFCLQDGAVLQDDGETKQSTIETVAFSDPVTAGNLLKTEDLNLYAPKKEPGKTRAWSPEPPKSARRQEVGKNASSAKSWLAVCGVLVALGVAGGGGWLYLQNQNNSPVKAANPAEASTPANNSASKIVLDDLSAPANSNSEPSGVSGSEDAKKEIAETIELWRKAAEARKLPDYLSRYAEKVDYFDKTGAGAPEIRAEAQKMFEAYSEIEISLTNLRVAVDADNKQATAVFDKEWSFETEKDLLEGKAHTKLRFQKSGKEWKIISEKYQKIYYMEN